MSVTPDFIAVLPASQLPAEGMIAVDAQDHPLLVGRLQNQLFAWVDRCPHAGAPLRAGTRHGEELTCGRHGWIFNLVTGESIPTKDPVFGLRAVPVKIEHDQVWVDISSLK